LACRFRQNRTETERVGWERGRPRDDIARGASCWKEWLYQAVTTRHAIHVTNSTKTPIALVARFRFRVASSQMNDPTSAATKATNWISFMALP